MATPAHTVPRIIPEALKALLDTDQAITILDVRRPEAFFASALTILGALRVPPDRVRDCYAEISRELLVVAFSEDPPEADSEQVARFLLDRGYPDVRVLQGGFNAWEALGYPTEPR